MKINSKIRALLIEIEALINETEDLSEIMPFLTAQYAMTLECICPTQWESYEKDMISAIQVAPEIVEDRINSKEPLETN